MCNNRDNTVARASHAYFDALLCGAAKAKRGQLKQAWVCAIQKEWPDLAAMDFCGKCRFLAAKQCVLRQERRRMIAEAAYYRAEHRGFLNGNPDQDWLEAEHEIDHIYFRIPDYLRSSLLFS